MCVVDKLLVILVSVAEDLEATQREKETMKECRHIYTSFLLLGNKKRELDG